MQSLLLTQLWRSDDALYQPLSGVTEQGIIIVRFQPDAREADIRALLRALDVQLVEGPAASGLYRLHSYREDLEPVVRDTVLLALPLSSLCAEDCIGPDPDRFPASSTSPEDFLEGAASPTDPRGSALDALRLPEEPIN